MASGEGSSVADPDLGLPDPFHFLGSGSGSVSKVGMDPNPFLYKIIPLDLDPDPYQKKRWIRIGIKLYGS